MRPVATSSLLLLVCLLLASPSLVVGLARSRPKKIRPTRRNRYQRMVSSGLGKLIRRKATTPPTLYPPHPKHPEDAPPPPRLFQMRPDGSEANDRLPYLKRSLKYAFGCIFEPDNFKVMQVMRRTNCYHAEDACWALEAYGGDVTDAVSTIQSVHYMTRPKVEYPEHETSAELEYYYHDLPVEGMFRIHMDLKKKGLMEDKQGEQRRRKRKVRLGKFEPLINLLVTALAIRFLLGSVI